MISDTPGMAGGGGTTVCNEQLPSLCSNSRHLDKMFTGLHNVATSLARITLPPKGAQIARMVPPTLTSITDLPFST